MSDTMSDKLGEIRAGLEALIDQQNDVENRTRRTVLGDYLRKALAAISVCEAEDVAGMADEAADKAARRARSSITAATPAANRYEVAARSAGFIQSDASHGAIGRPRDIDAGRFDATYSSWRECCEREGLTAG